MPKYTLMSAGITNVIERLRPYGAPASGVPHNLSAADSRRAGGESLHQWFVRLVDQYCDGDPRRVAIEENIALFASLKWDGDVLRCASMPALIAPCDLETYYLDEDCTAAYLRLDVNYETLGFPFSHPLAHVHVDGELQPRFALDGGTTGNVVLDYLEFIHRTYMPNEWTRWAKRVWQSQRDDEATFDLIAGAFEENQFGVLRANAVPVSELKRLLRNAKDSAFRGHLACADREILEYPTGR